MPGNEQPDYEPDGGGMWLWHPDGEEEEEASHRPIILPWDEWYKREAKLIRSLRGKRTNPNSPDQGMHILFSGPTQSGKTLLCRQVSRLHDWVVVFGTKAVDDSLDEYIAEGYTRIDHWPITNRDIRKQVEIWGRRKDGAPKALRYILWPKIQKIEDLAGYRDVYIAAMRDIFIQGSWCIVMDEGLWLADRNALNLGPYMSQTAFGAASNGVSMHLIVQRPANVPRITWSSCSQALLFHMGVTDDITEMSALGTYERAEVRTVLAKLEGHQFLDLPVRGGADWAISEVDLNSIYVKDATVP